MSRIFQQIHRRGERVSGLWASPKGRAQLLKRKWLIGGSIVAVIVVVLGLRAFFSGDNASARQQVERAVPVEVTTAERKTVPVRIESLGNVTPVASVAIK